MTKQEIDMYKEIKFTESRWRYSKSISSIIFNPLGCSGYCCSSGCNLSANLNGGDHQAGCSDIFGWEQVKGIYDCTRKKKMV